MLILFCVQSFCTRNVYLSKRVKAFIQQVVFSCCFHRCCFCIECVTLGVVTPMTNNLFVHNKMTHNGPSRVRRGEKHLRNPIDLMWRKQRNSQTKLFFVLFWIFFYFSCDDHFSSWPDQQIHLTKYENKGVSVTHHWQRRSHQSTTQNNNSKNHRTYFFVEIIQCFLVSLSCEFFYIKRFIVYSIRLRLWTKEKMILLCLVCFFFIFSIVSVQWQQIWP